MSKPWLELISSSGFVVSHLKRGLTTPGADQTLIICKRDEHSISLLNLDSPQTVVPIGLPYSICDASLEPQFVIVGSCNAVVCVSASNCPRSVALNYDLNDYACYETVDQKIYLWNSATRQANLLCPHKICGHLKSVCLGFRFDPIGNDFKVVRLVSKWNSASLSAEIYSRNSDVWREVDRPCDYPELNVFDVCLNGFLCCMVLDGMMVLDLTKELFSVIKLPVMDFDVRITNYNGSIAVISSKPKKFMHKIQVWSVDNEACLRDAAVDASWTVMLNIKVDFPVWSVYGCFNSGYLMLNAKSGTWLLYNSSKKVAKTIPLSISDIRQIFNYSESLISISGFKHLN